MKTFVSMVILIFAFSLSAYCGYVDSFKLSGFDVTQDGRKIVFIGYRDGVSSIYEVGINGGKAVEIVKPEEGVLYSSPKYSGSGTKILFVKFRRGVLESSKLCLVELSTGNLKEISDGNTLITEASFGSNDNLVFFLQAEQITSSSPVGVAGPRGFNIFQLNLNANAINKITTEDAYMMDCLSVLDSQELLFHQEAGDDGGIFLRTSKKTERIFPANDKLRTKNLYYNPSFDPTSKKLTFTAGGYELYQMSLHDRVGRKLFRSTAGQILNVRTFRGGETILLRQSTVHSRIFSVEASTGKVNEIFIQL